MAVVNIGTTPNNGAGDKLRDAFDKVNKEFDKTIKRDSDGVSITGVDGVKAEGYKVLKSDGSELGYLGESSLDEAYFGIYSGISRVEFTKSGNLNIKIAPSRSVAVTAKNITVNNKHVLTETDLPVMPTADGEYKLKVVSGVATWVTI